MQNFFVKIFFRNFLRQKGYSIINLAGLSLGLAVVIVIFLWIQFHLDFNTGFRDSDHIYRVTQRLWNGEETELVALTPGPLADVLVNSIPEVRHATKIHYGTNIVIRAPEVSLVEKKVLFIDSVFLRIFDFTLDQGTYSKENESWIILTQTAARKYFGEQDPLNKELLIEGNHMVNVIGVLKDLPENVTFDFDILLPMSIAIDLGGEIFPETWYRFSELETFIEFLPGTDFSSVETKIRHIKDQFTPDLKDEILIQAIQNIHIEPDIRYNTSDTISVSTLVYFGLAAFMVLIISSLNYIILSVSLSTGRIKSTGILKIHGATRSMIIREILAESLLMTIFAFFTAILIIELCSPIVYRLLDFTLSYEMLLQSRTLLMIIIFIVCLSMINGIFQALILSGIHPLAIFSQASPVVLSRRKVLTSLTALQFTVGMLLLIFSGTVYQQYKFMVASNPGFDRDRLLSVHLHEQAAEKLFNNLDQITQELKSLEYIEDVSFACSSPEIIETSAGEASWDGKPEGTFLNVQWNSVYFNYFNTLGINIVEGRDFLEKASNDIIHEDRCAFILNQTAVKAMGLSEHEVINREFELYGKKGPVIGIAEDFNFKPLQEPIQPMAFFIHPFYFRTLLIRSRSAINPEFTAGIQALWQKYLEDEPFDYSYVDLAYQDIYRSETRLFTYNISMAILIVLIASLGFSGLAILVMESKTKEIGIKKIFGAGTIDIILQLMSTFLKWILIAITLAVPAGYYISTIWLKQFAYQTTLSPAIFILPMLTILLIAWVSIGYRVIITSLRNPVDAIRYE